MNLNEVDFKKLHLQSFFVQVLIALIIGVVIVVAGYVTLFQQQWSDYQAAVEKENTLRDEFQTKSNQAANLDNLKKELDVIEASINVLLKQLPTDAEIPSLIQELHQAAYKQRLVMNYLTPQPVVVERPIERLPFSISVTGSYEQISKFAYEIGTISRSVTLTNIHISAAKSSDKGEAGKLMFSAMANTYKAMDLSESASAASAASAIASEE